MDGWINGWMGGWMDGYMDGWMDRWIHGWMDGWMDGWLDGWMDGWMDGWIILFSLGYILSYTTISMAKPLIHLLHIIYTQDIFIYISTKVKTDKIGKIVKIHFKLWFSHYVVVERPFKA